MRFAVLGTSIYIAINATSPEKGEHVEYWSVFLSITFMFAALGVTAQGIAKFFGKD